MIVLVIIWRDYNHFIVPFYFGFMFFASRLFNVISDNTKGFNII